MSIASFYIEHGLGEDYGIDDWLKDQFGDGDSSEQERRERSRSRSPRRRSRSRSPPRSYHAGPPCGRRRDDEDEYPDDYEDDGRKCYALRTGRVPGIYFSEAEARAQISGVPYSEWRRFRSTADARRFLDEGSGPRSAAGREDVWHPSAQYSAPPSRPRPYSAEVYRERALPPVAPHRQPAPRRRSPPPQLRRLREMEQQLRQTEEQVALLRQQVRQLHDEWEEEQHDAFIGEQPNVGYSGRRWVSETWGPGPAEHRRM